MALVLKEECVSIVNTHGNLYNDGRGRAIKFALMYEELQRAKDLILSTVNPNWLVALFYDDF